jgi:RNA polymerase sigma factor for flagellar operon FliA
MGNKFQTYAVPRIKGSIIDNIRQIDWVPRLVRQRASKIEKARQFLEADLGRRPTDPEMAAHMKMSLEEFVELKARANPIGCSSIYSRTSEEGDGSETEITDICSRDEDPLRHIVKDEFFRKVMGKGFTRIEREIIALHYYDGMTMKEIADSKGFSESRISQMHAEIMRRLELKMERIPNYISDIEEAIS